MGLIERASGFRRSATERAPFVFSYDIACPERARAVRRGLRRWRLDGQLSVHETVLTPPEAESLGVELLELLDPGADSLIVLRLTRRGDGPVYALSITMPGAPFARSMPPPPRHPHDGCHVLVYDVREPRRLRQMQRLAGAHGAFLQRSVYLFQGQGTRLSHVLRDAREILRQGEDDLRVYALAGTDDLWHLCGPVPPLVGPAYPLVTGAESPPWRAARQHRPNADVGLGEY